MNIRFLENNLVNIDFMKFDFEWIEQGCRRHGVAVADAFTVDTLLFCGRRLGWNIISGHHEVNIEINTEYNYYYMLTMFFSSYQYNWIDNFTFKKIKLYESPFKLNSKTHI